MPPAGHVALRYSQMMHGLQMAGVELNRQTLSELAIHAPASFDKVVELAKSHVTVPTPVKS